jgi:uncharacterized protein
MFLKRTIEKKLIAFSKFPVVALLGPRQSGKTTLARKHFNNHKYLSLEDPTILEFALSDPKGFLKAYENDYGIIVDEFQHAPQLLSYIQITVDEYKRPGYFVLTGSQNFLMNAAITQSLAGRVGILTLLPFSINELKQNNMLKDNVYKIIIDGFYPRLYAESFEPADFYPSYIHTYAERDVRQLVNVGNINTFQKFMMLCAGRVGQLLNIADLASSCDISVHTVNQWLSILENSYIIFLLQPHHVNFNKRLIKTPKIFFYDTGVACSLLGIKTTDTFAASPFRGHIFENLIISDLCKQFYNQGERPPLYFWRDHNGRIEIDCLIDQGLKLTPIEIKSSQTASNNFFDGIEAWNKLSENDAYNSYVIYGGDESVKRTKGKLVSWHDSGDLVAHLTP